MLDGNAVRGDHDSSTIGAAPAMNKYFRIRVRANQIEEFDNLGTGGFVACAPRNLNVFDAKGFNLAFLGRHFTAVLAEIDIDSHPRRVQGVESIRSWLAAAIKVFCNATEIGQSS